MTNVTSEQLIDEFRRRKRENLYYSVGLCAVGLALNFTLYALVSGFGLPLYLDMAGTLIATMLGGLIPGLFVGFMTNIINCFTDPQSIYYGITSVLIALASYWFSSKGWVTIKKPHMILCLILVLAGIGGGLGTLLPWFLDGISFDSESFSARLVEAGIDNIVLAQFLGNIIMDILDKTCTVLIALAIAALVPQKLKEKLVFDGWQQAPLSKEQTAAAEHISCRRVSVKAKIMLVLITALLLLGAVATGISFFLFRNAAIEQHIKLVQGVTNVMVSVIDADSVDRWLAEGESAEGYAETESFLCELRKSDSDIEYIYVYKIMEDGCHVVFDLDTEDEPGADPGDLIAFDEAFAPYIPTLLEGGEIEPIISDETYGWLLTVYTPIIDSSGKCVAYAAADVSMSNVMSYERNFLTGMISLFFAFFILIFVIVLWVVEYHIVLPVNTMSLATGSFAYEDEEQLDNNVARMRALNIQTGDEIENLYHAVMKTADDSVRQLEDIRRKNETISKMQNALILVLADIVESRDKNTGDHVRKTAAYTRVIMKKMKELGYYPEQMTDRFVENVGNSAPLHDVGKIKVSDMILNKPGRLTDEEFVIMQSHAAIGSEIIDQVIRLVPESDYLDEARNLAHYHHEKWNGTGYPDKLKGEEIPLSARIMAVADVFDALVSKRSYKEPFSFEQACGIIREGAGSHFDPLVADAFLQAEDECRKIARSFGDLSDVFVEDNHVDDSGKLR